MGKTDATFESQVFRTHALLGGDGGPTRLRAKAVRQSDTGSHFEGDFSVLEHGVTTKRFHGRFRLVHTEVDGAEDGSAAAAGAGGEEESGRCEGGGEGGDERKEEVAEGEEVEVAEGAIGEERGNGEEVEVAEGASGEERGNREEVEEPTSELGGEGIGSGDGAESEEGAEEPKKGPSTETVDGTSGGDRARAEDSRPTPVGEPVALSPRGYVEGTSASKAARTRDASSVDMSEDAEVQSAVEKGKVRAKVVEGQTATVSEGQDKDAGRQAELEPLSIAFGNVLDAKEDYILQVCSYERRSAPRQSMAATVQRISEEDVNLAHQAEGQAADTIGSVSVDGRMVSLIVEALDDRPDASAKRLQSFKKCLWALPGQLPHGVKSLAIRADRSKSDWALYLREIQTFAMETRICVVIYEHLDPTDH